MLIDTHCHLASAKFAADQMPQLLQDAADNHVSHILTLGTSLEDWQANLQLAQTHLNIRCALGIHPCDVHNISDIDQTMSQLQQLTQSHPEILAIGETGLDYYHPAPQGWSETDYHQHQQKLLRAHYQLAAEQNRPIVLHTRDKTGQQSLIDALQLAKEYAPQVRSQFHCHLGPYNELSSQIIELGGVLSFGGIATFNSAKDTTLAAASHAQAGTFMLETDAPYLAPSPHRGKTNQPAYLLHSAEHIAQARGETLEQLALHTTQTAQSFFNW